MKILNLYAGIGGNRKLWKDAEVTAVEYNQEIADVYEHFHPNDKVIVADAHEYLAKHWREFDFIWSSPPCQSHSRVRMGPSKGGRYDAVMPDSKLWLEIAFLQKFTENTDILFAVENVEPYYEPLRPPTAKLGRHLFWANFEIPEVEIRDEHTLIERGTPTNGFFDLRPFKMKHRKDQILRNCVDPNLGEYVFNCAKINYKTKNSKTMKNSKISWCDHTWNVARGCKKVSEECKYCYMYRDSKRYKGYDPNKVVQTSETTLKLPYGKEYRSKELSNGSRPLVFASSLTDVFLEELDDSRERIWKTMKDNQDLIFLVLTKRPERIADNLPEDWGEGYENVWLGTSVGLQKNMDKIHTLLQAPSQHYFLSAEPLLGEIDLISEGVIKASWRDLPSDGKNYLDWVLVGGESGNKTGPHKYRGCKLEWLEKVVQQCKATNTPVFVKQLGTALSKELNNGSRHGDNFENFPESIQVAEFPIFGCGDMGEPNSNTSEASIDNTFWDDGGKINPMKMINFLVAEGFGAYHINNDEPYSAPTLVQVQNNIVSIVNEDYIQKYIYDYVKRVLLGSENYAHIMNAIYRQRLNNYKFHILLESVKLQFIRDTKSSTYFFFKNGVIRTTSTEVKLIPYDELEGVVWKTDVIKFDIQLKSNGSYTNSEFYRFLRNLSFNDDANYWTSRENSLLSIVGYLLSRYKDGTKTKAITLMDVYTDGSANGGSGKTLLTEAISKMRNVAKEDGKLFKSNGNFNFSEVNINTDVILFDDVARNFDFEKLYSLTTTGIKVERKYKDAIYIPHENSPKVVLTTNYAIQGSGSSHKRRIHEFEVSHHYTHSFTPEDEFGHLLFDEWDNEQYNLFYNLMFQCSQLYLNEGIIISTPVNLSKTKLVNGTSETFMQWAEETLKTDTVYDKKNLLGKFGTDCGEKFIKQKTFTEWLRKYAECYDLDFKEGHSNLTRTIAFKEVKRAA